jgi:predicted enzyme related to lactoylglutathione lyase
MHVQFAELPVRDQDRAKAFYVEKLGCGVGADVPMGAADGWRWIELTLPGAETALHFTRRPGAEPSDDPVMVLVDDRLPQTVEALRARGVEIITEPGPAPYNPDRTVAEFRDSEGNRMILSSL